MGKIGEEEKPIKSKIADIFLYAGLLMVPSVIFIAVRVNTIEQTIEWRLDNIIRFFVLYVLLLSVFILHPFQYLARTKLFVKTSKGVQKGVHFLSTHKKLYILPTLLIAAFPFLTNLYQIKIFISVYLFLIFAIGLNYTVGFAGLLNLGHVLPFAAGAYAYAIMFKFFSVGFFTGLIIGAVFGALAAFFIALLTLRLKGDYLAIVTLALAEIFKIIMNNADNFSGGSRGISGIPQPTIPGFQLRLTERYILLYYVALVLVIFSIFVTSRLVRSRFGRAWESTREDSIASESSGVNLMKVRLMVFTLGGLFAGFAGVIYIGSSTYINSAISGVLFSITVLSIVVLGGMGSIRGTIFGTIIVILLPEYLRTFSEYRLLLYGAVLVIMMRYRQRGILPMNRIKYNRKSIEG